MFRRSAPALLFFLAAACASWPDLGLVSPSARSAGWPPLLPLSGSMYDGAATPALTDDGATQTVARADALRARAALLRAPISDSADIERLRARMRIAG